jgi:hypothetical protein
MTTVRSSSIGLAVVTAVLLFAPTRASAHCDMLNGPVVTAARVALQRGDVTPALKWVKESEEREVRDAFRQTMAVRGASAEARDLADRYFFETLVRLHRQGEGEPYTGVKPAGAIDPAIESADRAVETGAVNDLVTAVTERVAAGIRERFAALQGRRKHADDSVAAGRDYVTAYVAFIHYVEQLHRGISGAVEEGTHRMPLQAGSR